MTSIRILTDTQRFIHHDIVFINMPQEDYGMGGSDLAPDYPGPNLLGHEPLIGHQRRQRDIPVIRDELADAVDKNVTDLPDEPLIPALNTK